MCPQNKTRGEQPALATPLRVGPKTPANPRPTRVGKRGVQGGEAPMAGGLGGVPPTKPKGGRVAHPCNLATSGAQNAGKPSAHEGGQRGWRECSPLPVGIEDVPPGNQNWGRVAHINNPAASGTQNAGEPKANEGGQWGVQGGIAPMAGGVGGAPPT